MNILLTGSSGFIGKNLKESLSNKYMIKTPNREELDILNTEMVEEYLKRNQFDVIIHAANCNNSKVYNVNEYKVLDNNLRMFFNIARCDNTYKKMYYFGSGAEYDMLHYIPLMEEDYFGKYIPRDAYGFSKYIMSKHCERHSNIYDLRLFGVYGKYEEWEHRFISNAICRTLKNMPIIIKKNVLFDYLWVDDLSNVLAWFIENTPAHQHYNVCRGSSIDLFALAKMIRRVLNIDCKIVVIEDGYKPEYSGCNNRIVNESNKLIFTPFEETIKELCRYYKENIDLIDEKSL